MKHLIDSLKGIRMTSDPEDIACYGYDACGFDSLPSAILWPENAGQVARIMKYAYENTVPVVPRGAGTGMTGGSVPLKGSLVMSMERMNGIIDIDRENLTVLVEPGIINGIMQREVEQQGLFYPPDPASMNFCTIGGNVAENAGGPRALKYGVTKDYVMQIEAVLPDGEIITAGVRTHKGVVGYDLARLLTGSEGTLAVFTKIRLKLLPLPEDVATLLCLFKDTVSAGKAVSSITASGIIPRTLEFMDSEAIRAVEKFHSMGLPEGVEALLLIEVDGHPASTKREAERIAGICERLDADVRMAEDSRARDRLWECRRAVSPALYHISPSRINEDIVVPRNRIAEMLGELKRLSDESGIKIVNFGHAGDGNIHVNIMTDKADEEGYRKAESLVKEIFGITLRLGGTISGEHGIGIKKAPYISMEVNERELGIMKGIKRLFDPKDILNPGKIFP